MHPSNCPPAPGSSDAHRFLADAMLARLARWLRVLGLDAELDGHRSDREIVERAEREGRVLLTRDRRLVAELRPERALVIASDDPMEQFREVVASCRLERPEELLTRCLVCNAPLREGTPEEIAELVPERSRGLPGPMRRCPECGRVYWPGSHARRMIAVVDHVFQSSFLV